ncbi:MAG: protein kinase domain-containing protein, partial [Myxococcota bacterium]
MPETGDTKPREPGKGGGSRYAFIRKLGRGGMGEVALVFDRVRQQRVAQKRVLQADPDSLVRIKREFRAIREVLHPNLLRLYELEQDERGPFFTMEALEGTDFLAYCRGQFIERVGGVSMIRSVREAATSEGPKHAPTLPSATDD